MDAAKEAFAKLNKHDLKEAIAAGVEAAMWRMITNATDMPCANFYEAIRKGAGDGVCRTARDAPRTPNSL